MVKYFKYNPNSRLVLKTSRENLEFNRYIKLFSNEGLRKKELII